MKSNRKTEKNEQPEVQDEVQEQQEQFQFKNVFVLTNTKGNTLKSFYVHSLSTTIRLGMLSGIKIIPLFIGNVDSTPMAKNELLSNLKDAEYDAAVFIDSDLGWDAVSFIECLSSKEDVVGLPVVKKTLGNVVFDLDMNVESIETNGEEGLFKVKHASTGFLKLSNKVITELLDGSISITNNTGNEVKNVFETEIKDGQFINESIVLCNKIKDMGYDIWLNSKTTCAQTTDNIYAVDFANALQQSQGTPEGEVQQTENIQDVEIKDDEVKSLYE